jgi:ribosomal protein S18 acetylase RimI-like enzyme
LSGADAELYWALRLRALHEHPEAFGSSPEEHPPLAAIAEAFEKRWQTDENYVLGAFINGNLVGMAGFRRETNRKERHKGNIRGMYVIPEAQGREVGRALLEEILFETRQLTGLEQLHLSVTEQNTAAKSLYFSCGFELYATAPRALKIGPRYLNELHLLRYLSR